MQAITAQDLVLGGGAAVLAGFLLSIGIKAGNELWKVARQRFRIND